MCVYVFIYTYTHTLKYQNLHILKCKKYMLKLSKSPLNLFPLKQMNIPDFHVGILRCFYSIMLKLVVLAESPFFRARGLVPKSCVAITV